MKHVAAALLTGWILWARAMNLPSNEPVWTPVDQFSELTTCFKAADATVDKAIRAPRTIDGLVLLQPMRQDNIIFFNLNERNITILSYECVPSGTPASDANTVKRAPVPWDQCRRCIGPRPLGE